MLLELGGRRTPCSHRSFHHSALSPVPTGTLVGTAYCPLWESTGLLGWWDMAATCLLVPFRPVARARLVLLPRYALSLVPGSCSGTAELSLPRARPAWLFLPLLLKALPRPSVTQGSHRLQTRPLGPHGGCGQRFTALRPPSSGGACGGDCTTSELRAPLGSPESSHC